MQQHIKILFNNEDTAKLFISSFESIKTDDKKLLIINDLVTLIIVFIIFIIVSKNFFGINVDESLTNKYYEVLIVTKENSQPKNILMLLKNGVNEIKKYYGDAIGQFSKNTKLLRGNGDYNFFLCLKGDIIKKITLKFLLKSINNNNF